MSSKVDEPEPKPEPLNVGDSVVVVKKGQFRDQKGVIHCTGMYVGVQLENGVHIRAKYSEVKSTK